MVAEWYFLVSIMTGAFDPQTGWQHVKRTEYVAASEQACWVLQEGTVQAIKERLKPGEGAVVTGCQVRGR